MADEEFPIRIQLREVYLDFFRKGTPISLSQLAERSKAYVGKSIPYLTIRSWSSVDNWSSQLRSDLSANPKLQTTLEFLARWKKVVISGDDLTWKDRAAAARAFLQFVTKVPEQLRWSTETDITDVSQYLQKLTLARWDSIPITPRASLSSTWAQLDRMVDISVYVEEEGVDAEGILLSGRKE